MTRDEQLDFLIRQLAPEAPLPRHETDKWPLLRALMNIHPPFQPRPGSLEFAQFERFLRVQDTFLQGETAAKGIVTLTDLAPVRPRLYLWQGDITRLKVGAIVNAANSHLLGCFQPNHRCIDNAIHSYAGVQLRRECADIMRRQGHPEPTGAAKITRAYNLPAEAVLHTVGPIIRGALTRADCAQLADCYRACLQRAAERGIDSVAFCCIGTGEFRFPNQAAAEIAVGVVEAFLTENPAIQVVFNVFKDVDLRIYRALLGV